MNGLQGKQHPNLPNLNFLGDPGNLSNNCQIEPLNLTETDFPWDQQLKRKKKVRNLKHQQGDPEGRPLTQIQMVKTLVETLQTGVYLEVGVEEEAIQEDSLAVTLTGVTLLEEVTLGTLGGVQEVQEVQEVLEALET